METIATRRLLLEPWDERDRQWFRLLSADVEMMRYIGPGRPATAAEADETFEKAREHWRRHGFGWRAALDRATDDWLGYFVLNYVGRQADAVTEDEVSVGWWIIRRAWGRGFATEGARAICAEGFEQLRIERLIALIQPANTTSALVARKIGMWLDSETVSCSGEPLSVPSML